MELGRQAGLTRGHYGRIENGIKKPSNESCRRISVGLEFYGVRATPLWLIFGQGKPPTRIRKSKAPAVPVAEETQHADEKE